MRCIRMLATETYERISVARRWHNLVQFYNLPFYTHEVQKMRIQAGKSGASEKKQQVWISQLPTATPAAPLPCPPLPHPSPATP